MQFELKIKKNSIDHHLDMFNAEKLIIFYMMNKMQSTNSFDKSYFFFAQNTYICNIICMTQKNAKESIGHKDTSTIVTAK